MWCNGAFKYMECKSMFDLEVGDGYLHEFKQVCDCFNPHNAEFIEVVGNIYENSELLNK